MALSSPNRSGSLTRYPQQWVPATSFIWEGGVVGRYAAGANQGYVDRWGTDPTQVVVGVAAHNADGTQANPPNVQVNEQIILLQFPGASLDTTYRRQLVWGVDDNTGSMTPAGFNPVGQLIEVKTATSAYVDIGPTAIARALAEGAAAAGKPVARYAVTSIGTYTYAAGVITASAVNATLTKDVGAGTPGPGDVVWLPPGIAAAASDAGLYVLATDTGSSAKFLLKRHPYMAHGLTLPSGTIIEIGGEGTSNSGNFSGSQWKNLAGAGVVGTADLHWYPKIQSWPALLLASGTYTLGHTGANSEPIYLSAATRSIEITSNTHAGTLGTNRLEAPAASRTIGYAGTALLVINSLVDAGTVAGSDTSTVDALWSNW